MSDQQPIIRKPGTASMDVVPAGTGTAREVLIGPDDAPHFALRRFVMEPHGGMPYHTNTVEHEQYILSGSATVRIGEDTHEIVAGDSVFIPAGVPHDYQAGPDGFEFLCIVPNLEDTITLVDE